MTDQNHCHGRLLEGKEHDVVTGVVQERTRSIRDTASAIITIIMCTNRRRSDTWAERQGRLGQ